MGGGGRGGHGEGCDKLGSLMRLLRACVIGRRASRNGTRSARGGEGGDEDEVDVQKGQVASSPLSSQYSSALPLLCNETERKDGETKECDF